MSKTICVKCDKSSHLICGIYVCSGCAIAKHSTNYVTGEQAIEREYLFCHTKNYDGNCPDFTPRRPWWRRLIRPHQS